MATKKTKEELEIASDKLKQQQDGRIKQVLRELPELNSSTLSFLATNAEAELEARAGEESENAEVVKIGDIAEGIEAASQTFGKFTGLSTGLGLLDEVIGGLKPSETTLIAGASNNGKSSIAIQMAAAVAQQVPTLFITLEMQPEMLGARIRNSVGEDYKNLDLYFQRTFKLDYRSVEPLIKNAYNNGVRCVFIDYLQYLGVGMKPEEVAKISRMISELCLSYDIPFVVVVSIRKGDNKGSRKWVDIQLEDIMGTSAIGYDADNVLLVSRQNPDADYDEDGIWVKHLKSRNMSVHYGGGQFLRFKWDRTAITDDDEYFQSYSDEYLFKKTEVKPLKKPEQAQLLPESTEPITPPKQLSKFEARKLGLPIGDELSTEELAMNPFH